MRRVYTAKRGTQEGQEHKRHKVHKIVLFFLAQLVPDLPVCGDKVGFAEIVFDAADVPSSRGGD
jgi:hypothetical protein